MNKQVEQIRLEVERLRFHPPLYSVGWVLNAILTFIDNLPKEQPLQAEELIQKTTQATIRKACEWLSENLWNFHGQYNTTDTKLFIEQFKKEMEEEI